MALGFGLRRRLSMLKGQVDYYVWSFTSEGRANGKRLNALRNRYRGQRCFVIGNGPSLLKCDLGLLANEITIASNGHYLIWDKLDYRPTLFTVEDFLVAEDRSSVFKELTGPLKIFPFDLRSLMGEANEGCIYINFERQHRPFPRFSQDINVKAYWGGTVSFMNMQLAAYLGCKKIILIGFDHNYTVPAHGREGNVIKSQEHDANHIHPNYFGPGFRWNDPNLQRMEVAYLCAREELSKLGIDVVNATVGGNLEVYPRVHYEDLF